MVAAMGVQQAPSLGDRPWWEPCSRLGRRGVPLGTSKALRDGAERTPGVKAGARGTYHCAARAKGED